MIGWLALGFGALLIVVGVRAVVLERRAARRGRRPVRPDLTSSVALLVVLGSLGVLLGLAVLLVFPRD